MVAPRMFCRVFYCEPVPQLVAQYSIVMGYGPHVGQLVAQGYYLDVKVGVSQSVKGVLLALVLCLGL